MTDKAYDKLCKWISENPQFPILTGEQTEVLFSFSEWLDKHHSPFNQKLYLLINAISFIVGFGIGIVIAIW